ncbi:MAG TPA: TlpA disulfide reductase family protein [Solirubrobacteraceae bacterium]|jgi:thiol-disulfide isomerase/thioredoxin
MTPRLFWTAVAGAASALAVVLTIAVAELPKHTSTGNGTGQAQLSQAQAQALLAGSPPALASLHARGGELLAAGAGAWQAQLRALRGLPLVVNKWASWCVPCQGERAIFQRAAANWGRRVAFVGIDSGDSGRGDAQAFLRVTPMSYPSFYDSSGALGREVTGSPFTPVTLFLTSGGSRYPHQGPYTSVAALERDIERYAVGA